MSEAHQILPSRHGRSASGEQDNEAAIWDHDEQLRVDTEAIEQPDAPATPTRKISPTMLAITTQCELRALWKARGEKGVGPSPFSKSTMADGNEYEERMTDVEHRKIWFRAINQALELDLPEDMPVRNRDGDEKKRQEIRMRDNETPQAFVKRVTKELEDALPGKASAPFFLVEPQLATIEGGALMQGRPDLMIWTGKRKKWILADLKCSEEAKRTHGMQVAAYARMLQAMRPHKKNIDPTGVIIHCAPGYRYTATSSKADKETTLNHSQATPFPLDSLSDAVDQAIEGLANPNDVRLQEALNDAVFSSVCVECEFRFRCYPRFLQQRHVSLVPLQKAELGAVMETGTRTVDELIDAIGDPESSAHASLLDIKDGSPLQLGYLRQKAQKILEKGLYSKWRAAPEELENPLFFASVEKNGGFSPPLDQLNDNPTCLVVYTEQERRVAWAKIYAEKKQNLCSGMSTFILSEIVQESVHGPLPSITLRPLAMMLDKVTNFDKFSEFYPASHTEDIPAMERTIQDAPTPEQRLKDLQSVWRFLTSASIPFSL